MLRIFLSRPSSVLSGSLKLATHIQLRFSLEWAYACLLFNNAHASVTTSLPGWETLFYVLLGARRLFQETFSLAPFRSRETVSHLSYYAFFLRWYSSDSSLGHFCIFFLLAQYLDLTHCDCSLSLKKKCTFPSSMFSTYTMEEIWQLAHGAQQRCYPLYRWQRNTARSCIDFTSHSQLLRKYQCAQEHPAFSALTDLFPSISRCKQSDTRADKQDGDSNDDPIFSPTYFHSAKWPVPRVLSAVIMMSTHFHCFSACSSWPTVWIFHTVITWPTLTNPSWPAAALSIINLQPRIRRPPCYSSRATGTSVAPTADSKRQANFFARPSPSCSILTFGRPAFADHPRASFSSGDYSTALFLADSNTVWPSKDFRHNLHILIWWC